MRLLAAARFSISTISFRRCRASARRNPEAVDDLLFLELAGGLFLLETGCFAFELEDGLVFLLRLLFGLVAFGLELGAGVDGGFECLLGLVQLTGAAASAVVFSSICASSAAICASYSAIRFVSGSRRPAWPR
ncbi:MAG: hypothetical protein ACLT1T_06365 [Oscillospiraceae bacterium]